MRQKQPVLFIVVPCYNEEEVLPVTAPLFLSELKELIDKGRIHNDSRILFVNDGSSDRTWEIIEELAKENSYYIGISQSRNRGHQSTVLAGLMESREMCDITISIDCDGQDDIKAMDEMVDKYLEGYEIVYGVRSSRETDSWAKRNTAQAFYRLMNKLGADTIYNHADYRLVSSRVLKEFSDFKEVNLFLRGMFTLVGFKSTCVYFERYQRLAGESHYPLKKMIGLAVDGITSMSVKPITMIMVISVLLTLIGFAGVIWNIVLAITGSSAHYVSLIIFIIFLLNGIQLACLSIIGNYVGKTYMEAKNRPRYIISDRTWE